jgi:hypothetical protein
MWAVRSVLEDLKSTCEKVIDYFVDVNKIINQTI